jgi:hypothetical protein
METTSAEKPTAETPTANVVLFAFRDAARTAQVVDAARCQTGVRSVGVVARSTDCEVRIVGGAGETLTEARWLASALAVLDVLSRPLSNLAARDRDTTTISLPDSLEGYATFGRLVPAGELVILVAVCEDAGLPLEPLTSSLGTAVFRMPADCAIRMSGHRSATRGTGTPPSVATIAHRRNYYG